MFSLDGKRVFIERSDFIASRAAINQDGKMKRIVVLISAWVVLTGFSVVIAEKETDSITVSGWLEELDPSAHTFAIRNGKKLLQFTIDPSHTNIQVDDWRRLQTSLGSVRLGAAVLVTLSRSGGHLTVESVKFTHRPATAIPAKSRPGFVFSPYTQALFDVRKYKHGDMLEDVWPGGIFLVP